MEDIDPDNKHCPYKRWLKFGRLHFWRMMISYRLRRTLRGLCTRKLNIHFAPRNFSFVFWELEVELTVVFLGETTCSSVLQSGQRIDNFLLSNTTDKKGFGFDINRDMFFEM